MSLENLPKIRKMRKYIKDIRGYKVPVGKYKASVRKYKAPVFRREPPVGGKTVFSVLKLKSEKIQVCKRILHKAAYSSWSAVLPLPHHGVMERGGWRETEN